MPDRRRDGLKQVRFHNPRLARIGVEVTSMAELRQRVGAQLDAPERVEFFVLIVVRQGRGSHIVDFTELPVEPGTAVLVRPGQVQQWRLSAALDGPVLLAQAQALAPALGRGRDGQPLLALDEWPPALPLARALLSEVVRDIVRLRQDVERFDGSAVAAALVWHELMALLLRLGRARMPQSGGPPLSTEGDILRLFVRELEARFHTRPSVNQLARRIGYSESALARACLAAKGQTAKQVVDARIALEAKRLLAHSDASVAEIAHRLGFSEATNFVKFFRRIVGTPPLQFRVGTLGGGTRPGVSAGERRSLQGRPEGTVVRGS